MSTNGIDSYRNSTQSVAYAEESSSPERGVHAGRARHSRRGRMDCTQRRECFAQKPGYGRNAGGNEELVKQAAQMLVSMLEQLAKMMEMLLKTSKSKQEPATGGSQEPGPCKGKGGPEELVPAPQPNQPSEPTPVVPASPEVPGGCQIPSEPAPNEPVPNEPAPSEPEPSPEPSPAEPTPFDADGFAQTIRNLTNSGGKNGLVNEEKLQYAIVGYMLQERSEEAYNKFMQTFPAVKANKGSNRKENATKEALQGLVNGGHLSQEEAESIQGASFDAAQLDNNLDLLWDGRGMKTDGTVARLPLEEAISRASAKMAQFHSGEQEIKARDLTRTRTEVGEIEGQKSGKGKKADLASVSGTQTPEGFLWKPESESDGKLVVLLPSEYRGEVDSFGLYEQLPPSEENLIEEGRFSGDDANGGRPHFRFSKSGGSYPDSVYAVALLSNGEQLVIPIPETSSRQE